MTDDRGVASVTDAGAAAGEPVPSTYDARLVRGFPPPPELRVAPDQVYTDARRTQWFMQHVREVVPTADVTARREPTVELATAATPGAPSDPTPAAPSGGLDDIVLVDVGDASAGAPPGSWTLPQMLAATDSDGILVLHNGRLLYERYFASLQPHSTHLWHSITKSLGSCVAANLVDRRLLDPEAPVVHYVPELADSAYGDATLRHLLDMTVGIRYVEDHQDFDSEDSRLDRLCGLKPRRAADEPGSIYDYAATTIKEGEHGRALRYVSLNTDVLGWVMERATGVATAQLLRDEIWGKLGGEHDAFVMLDGAGSALLDGGFCSSLRDLARFGQMLAQGGRWGGRQVVPEQWIDDTRRNGDKAAFAASDDPEMLPLGSYRNCFWVAEPTGRTVLLGTGMYGQMLYVDPDPGVVVAKFSSQPHAGLAEPITRTFFALESLARALT